MSQYPLRVIRLSALTRLIKKPLSRQGQWLMAQCCIDSELYRINKFYSSPKNTFRLCSSRAFFSAALRILPSGAYLSAMSRISSHAPHSLKNRTMLSMPQTTPIIKMIVSMMLFIYIASYVPKKFCEEERLAASPNRKSTQKSPHHPHIIPQIHQKRPIEIAEPR